jgi:chitin disaccharide deacetylase
MMKEKKLIINADGFGFTFGINRAIFEVAREGAISSISVNSNFPAVEDLPEFHATFPRISIGVHCNPIVGKPVSDPDKVKSLLDPDGSFWGSRFPERLRSGLIDLHELELELSGQVQRVSEMGIPITHLDSHQNQHLRPGFFKTFLRVAKLHRIRRMRTHRHFICMECPHPVKGAAKYYAVHPMTAVVHVYTRWLMIMAERQGMRMADRLLCVGHATGVTKGSFQVWKSIMRNMPGGVNEIYCHPGYPDETLKLHARYVSERERERRVLSSSAFRNLLQGGRVRLIGFHEL